MGTRSRVPPACVLGSSCPQLLGLPFLPDQKAHNNRSLESAVEVAQTAIHSGNPARTPNSVVQPNRESGCREFV